MAQINNLCSYCRPTTIKVHFKLKYEFGHQCIISVSDRCGAKIISIKPCKKMNKRLWLGCPEHFYFTKCL